MAVQHQAAAAAALRRARGPPGWSAALRVCLRFPRSALTSLTVGKCLFNLFFFLIDQAKIKGKEGKTFNSSEEYKQSCGLLYARSKPKQTRRVSAARADNARIPTHCHLCSPVSALLMFLSELS